MNRHNNQFLRSSLFLRWVLPCYWNTVESSQTSASNCYGVSRIAIGNFLNYCTLVPVSILDGSKSAGLLYSSIYGKFKTVFAFSCAVGRKTQQRLRVTNREVGTWYRRTCTTCRHVVLEKSASTPTNTMSEFSYWSTLSIKGTSSGNAGIKLNAAINL